MLGDYDLSEISDKYNKYKTTLTSSNIPNFSEYVNTPELNSIKSGVSGVFNMDKSGFDADKLMNDALSGFSSSFSRMGSFKFNVNNSKIDGDEGDCDSGDIICKIIQLIRGIFEIPKRFSYMSLALMEGTGSIIMGIEGISKSIALGTKDIYLLIIAILNIVFKYSLCILSFIITTIAGCLLIHPISLIVLIIYLGIMFIVDKIHSNFGVDFSSNVDQVFDHIKWPEAIQMYCYSCFGKRVKLRDILVDVGVISDIGDMINYDFNNRMPEYLKPAKPLGKLAQKHLDIAVN